MKEFLTIFAPLFSYYLGMILELNIFQVLLACCFLIALVVYVSWKKWKNWRKSDPYDPYDVMCLDLDGFSDPLGESVHSLTFVFTEYYESQSHDRCAHELAMIIKKCPNLSNLTITECQFLTDKTLHYIENNTEMLRKLSSLSIKNCKGLTGDGLIYTFEQCERLQSLCLNGCTNLSKALFKQMNFRSLEELDLYGCKNDDKTLEEIVSHHPGLIQLSISCIPSLSTLKKILRECPKLQLLNILSLNLQ